MQQYELGGVKFIIHEGEVYCRYADVFEPSEMTEELGDYGEEPEPVEELAPTTKSGKPRPSCKVCGKPGHNRKTCPEAGNTEYSRAVDRKQNEVPESLQEKVKKLVEEGCSLDEVLLTFPLEPAAKLVEYHRMYSGTVITPD